jgi:hypothetical protein
MHSNGDLEVIKLASDAIRALTTANVALLVRKPTNFFPRAHKLKTTNTRNTTVCKTG